MKLNWGLIMGAAVGIAVIGGGVLLLRRRQIQEGVIQLYPGGSPDFYTGGMPVLKPAEPSSQPTDYLTDFRKINPQPLPVLKPAEPSSQPTDYLADWRKINPQPLPVLTKIDSTGLLEQVRRVTLPMPILKIN